MNRLFIITFSVFTLLLLSACELDALRTKDQRGPECTEGLNEFGSCNRNQACVNGTCSLAGEECKGIAENAPNSNGFGYCLQGYTCKDGQCIASVGCLVKADCGENMLCQNNSCHCESAFGNCNGDPNDGCETSFSQKNLQGCGICAPRYANCNDDWADGCEVDLLATKQTACGECVANYADCNNDPSDGCEVDLLATKQTACGVCVANYANCNNDLSDGCEVDLLATKQTACGECVANYANCNNDPSDGCELSLTLMRKKDCNTCLDEYGDCDNDPSNGCETDLLNDQNNCGWCGNICDSCNRGFCRCATKVCAPGEHCDEGECKCGNMGFSCGYYNLNEDNCTNLHSCDPLENNCVCQSYANNKHNTITCTTVCQPYQCSIKGYKVQDLLQKTPYTFIILAWLDSLNSPPTSYLIQKCAF